MTGFTGADVWGDWIANDLDQTSGIAHREALALGTAYAIVWARGDGSPRVTVESPRQVSVITDPGSRHIVAALKRWETATTTEAVLYEPDQITRLRAGMAGATTLGVRAIEKIPNPLGAVPVVRFRNGDRLMADGGLGDRRPDPARPPPGTECSRRRACSPGPGRRLSRSTAC